MLKKRQEEPKMREVIISKEMARQFALEIFDQLILEIREAKKQEADTKANCDTDEERREDERRAA
jgi:hypothetical protein